MTEKISVVIPCYNCGETIERCINSILSEDIEMEIIVVNDCSTDKTREILMKYPQVKVIDREKNGGMASCRNDCIKNSNESIVFFVDSDVIIEKGCILKLLKEIEYYDLVYPTLNFELGGLIHPKRPQEFIYPHMSTAMMIKRRVFNKVGIFDEEFISYAEDTDLFLRCVLENISSKYVKDAIVIHLDRGYDSLKRYCLECRNIAYGVIKWSKIDKKQIKEKYYFCFTIKYIIILFGLGILNINPFGWKIYMERQKSGFVFLKQIIKENQKFTEKRNLKSFLILMRLYFKGLFEGINCGIKWKNKNK